MYTTVRYRSIPNQFQKNVLDDFPVFPAVIEGTRIVDDSYYTPNHEANKILAKQQAMGILSSIGAFDSPQDIASGSVNVYARQKGRDLAELTQQARQLQEQAVKDVNRALKDKAEKAKSEKAQAQAQAQAQTQAQAQAQPQK